MAIAIQSGAVVRLWSLPQSGGVRRAMEADSDGAVGGTVGKQHVGGCTAISGVETRQLDGKGVCH